MKAPELTTAQVAAKATEQRKAKRAEEAKLATQVHNAIAAQPKAQPKALKKGSGALVGVAQGATDGQPHTRRAVQEARAREAQEQHADGKVQAKLADADGTTRTVWWDAKLVHNGFAYPNKARCEEAKKAMAAEPKGEPKGEDTRKIKVVAKDCPYKPGSKAEATFQLFAKAKTVAEFRALVAKSPSSYDPGYIRYSARDGYITVG